ncbi:MAG TPA: serine/threonine protein kinase, partial [Lacipirellulaceae bacterium]
LRELFKRNGYRVLVSSDPQRALSRFHDDPDAADMILFTTSNNGRSALEVFNRLGQEQSTRSIPAVLLLDQIHDQWAEEAVVGAHRAVAKMPIKMRELRDLLVGVSGKKVS